MNNGFKQAIGKYLDTLAQSDGMFAQFYKSNGKDIPDCCNFIISEVKKTGRTGFADDEIFGMAKHYFEEADIKPYKGASEKCRVVTNVHSDDTFQSRHKPVQAEVAKVKKEEVAPAPVVVSKPSKRPAVIDECQLSLF